MAFEFAKNGVLEEGWKGKAAVGAAGLGASLYAAKKLGDMASDAADGAGKFALKKTGLTTQTAADAAANQKFTEGQIAGKNAAAAAAKKAAEEKANVVTHTDTNGTGEHVNAIAQKGIKGAASVASDATTAIGHGIDTHPGVAALAAGAVLGAVLRRRRQNQGQ
jgi:MYXO-CTERM domain-containing protein